MFSNEAPPSSLSVHPSVSLSFYLKFYLMVNSCMYFFYSIFFPEPLKLIIRDLKKQFALKIFFLHDGLFLLLNEIEIKCLGTEGLNMILNHFNIVGISYFTGMKNPQTWAWKNPRIVWTFFLLQFLYVVFLLFVVP